LNKSADNDKIISTGNAKFHCPSGQKPQKGAIMIRIKHRKKWQRSLLAFILVIALATALSPRISAAGADDAVFSEGDIAPAGAKAAQTPSEQALGQRSVNVYVNGSKYTGKAFLNNSVTYVGIREFSMLMGVSAVSWDSKTKTATVKSDELVLSAKNQSLYIKANDRYLWAGSGIIILNGTMYVPIRTLAKAFGCEVRWDPKSFCAFVVGGGKLENGQSFYNSDELYWLARIIHAEAQGEPLLGKVCVGNVVLNRVKSDLFPGTIYGVIFDRKNGVQFTPVASGTIHCTPSEESIIAAKLCLDGANVSDKVLFFVNEALAQSSWVSDNRAFVMTVGNHKFYA